MSGFNLPPGVSIRDIPGNTPRDEANDEIAEHVSLATYKAIEWGWDKDDFLQMVMELWDENWKVIEDEVREAVESEDLRDFNLDEAGE